MRVAPFLLFSSCLLQSISVNGLDPAYNTSSSYCSQFSSSCGVCVKQLGCVWCTSSNACEDLKVIKFYDNCSNWMWGQCSLEGKFMIAITCVCLMLIIGVIGVCLYRCIRKRKMKRKDQENKMVSVVDSEREFLIGHGSFEYLGSTWRGITEKLNKNKHGTRRNVNSIN